MQKTYEELKEVMENNPTIFEGLSEVQNDMFENWLPENMIIYRAFVRLARVLKATKKKKKYSARAIYHQLSWEDLMSDTSTYQIDYNTSAFVSRLAMTAEGDLEDMFMKRTQKKQQHELN